MTASDPGSGLPRPPPGTVTEPAAPGRATDARPPTLPDLDLGDELGRGGMGVVYRGRQVFLGREVAVKVLLGDAIGAADFAARFEREARLLARLDHPHIVACHTAGLAPGGVPYLVMELVRGPSLAGWLRRHGPLPRRDALRLARQVADALGYALERGVLHRDVKAENVLLEPAPASESASPSASASNDVAEGASFPFRAKLADLGLARPRTVDDVRITATDMTVGTPATMAPEQAMAPNEVDHRADIFGLGCVLYEALTGSPPFSGTTATEVLVKKVLGQLPAGLASDAADDGIDPAIRHLLRSMLAPEPSKRPATYAALIAALDRLVDGRPDAGPEERAQPTGASSATPAGGALPVTPTAHATAIAPATAATEATPAAPAIPPAHAGPPARAPLVRRLPAAVGLAACLGLATIAVHRLRNPAPADSASPAIAPEPAAPALGPPTPLLPPGLAALPAGFRVFGPGSWSVEAGGVLVATGTARLEIDLGPAPWRVEALVVPGGAREVTLAAAGAAGTAGGGLRIRRLARLYASVEPLARLPGQGLGELKSLGDTEVVRVTIDAATAEVHVRAGVDEIDATLPLPEPPRHFVVAVEADPGERVEVRHLRASRALRDR